MFYHYSSANFQRSRVVVQQCDSKDQFSLVQCSTSVLMSNCTSDMMGWVQCSLNGKLLCIFMNTTQSQ